MKYTNHDKLIKQVFFNTNGRLNGRRTDKVLANKYPNIGKYLDDRYSDSTCLRETLLRIYFDIEIRPVCLNCDKQVEFIGKKKKMYANFCCCKCNTLYHDLGHKWQLTQQKYNLEHYGVKYNFQVEKFKKKRTETLLEKYGVEHPLSNNDIHQKFVDTLVKNHNGKSVKWIYKNVIMKKSLETSLKKYGVEYPMQSKEIQDKFWATMKKNHSFNRSIQEDECYEILVNNFGKEDVVRQYKCDRYPWHCDFYIKSLDLFIECNFHWTHGGHPFNENDKNDLKIINEWKTKNTEYFNNAINTWSNLDVNKRNTANKNKLNYLEFYSLDEVKEWIKLQTKK